MDASLVQRSAQDVVYDDLSSNKRIGLLALSTDLQTERDYAQIIPGDSATVYTSRVAFDNPSTPDNLRQNGATSDGECRAFIAGAAT